MKDQWYHNAILYSLDVETYKDSNGDGIGDFQGLISKLDHLSSLGVNCIWLRPFFPSPLVDDGYDVMNYNTIDPRFGTLGDFVDFVVKAKALGLKILIDLVVNHSSDQHEWFQKSREGKDSYYRDFYIWRDEKPGDDQQYENMLNEGGIWNYDQKAKAWYMHHFHKEQPDLNLSNPEVVKEIKKIMGLWLQLGVSGFRIDAAHIIVHESKGEIFSFLEELREFINSRNNEAVLLAEANVPYNELQKFFGEDGNKRMHMMFNFYTNKNMFLAISTQSATPLISTLEELQDIKGQWVNFLRTHDELSLEMLTEKERKPVFEAFAPQEDMRLFGHGIRRRLPPMFNGDRKKIELIYAIMFSLPGIPLINYGEEIAMGEDLSEEGRASVRTAMQWNDYKNAGFSNASTDKLVHPVIDFGDYDYRKVNVSRQQKDPDSFLNWVERLISTRKHSPQLSFGYCEILKNNSDSVLSFCNEWENEVVILFHNLKNEKCTVKINIKDKKLDEISEIFSDKHYKEVKDLESEIELSAYGFRWFKGQLE